jgi:hypothetical protein
MRDARERRTKPGKGEDELAASCVEQERGGDAKRCAGGTVRAFGKA